MNVFGPAAIFGLIFGFMFGTGCSLAILYSIFLGGYRSGVADSLLTRKPERFTRALAKIEAKINSAAS